MQRRRKQKGEEMQEEREDSESDYSSCFGT